MTTTESSTAKSHDRSGLNVKVDFGRAPSDWAQRLSDWNKLRDAVDTARQMLEQAVSDLDRSTAELAGLGIAIATTDGPPPPPGPGGTLHERAMAAVGSLLPGSKFTPESLARMIGTTAGNARDWLGRKRESADFKRLVTIGRDGRAFTYRRTAAPR